MPSSNLFFTDKFCPLSPKQVGALGDIGLEYDVKDLSCTRESINTCGKSIDELLAEYPLYSPLSGLGTTWGDILFPWETDENTPNLDLDQSIQTWSEAKFKSIVSYYEDSLVLLIEDDGYVISLYKANQDVYSANPAFDYTKWDKVCSIELTSPTALPSIEELLSKYEIFNLSPYLENWGDFSENWSTSLPGEINESDVWNEARVNRENLYESGDIALSYGPCEDVLCAWIALQNLPNIPFILEQYKTFSPEKHYSGNVSVVNGELVGKNTKFSEELVLGSVITIINSNLDEYKFTVVSFNPSSPNLNAIVTPSNITLEGDLSYKGVFWQKIYCVETGRNKCLEFSQTSSPVDLYSPTEIGSMGHVVEVPIQYPKLSKSTLNELAEVRQPPTVLSEDQINSLKQPN